MDNKTFQTNPLDKKLSEALQALWHDAQGNWEAAHDTLQDDSNLESHWVHAYLHRKEGDTPNARYWYNRAQQPFPNTSLDEEWENITRALLSS